MLSTAVVGSLPKPAWLAEGDGLWPRWRLTGEALRQAQADAAALWITEQLRCDLDIISDGELSRQHFVHGFLEQLAGVDMVGQDGTRRMIPRVVGPLRLPGRACAAAARQLRAATGRRVKLALPGPLTLSDAVVDEHYGERRVLAAAFAAVLNEEAHALAADGVDIVQFDEPALVASDEAFTWGLPVLERAIAGLGCATALHVCDSYSAWPTGAAAGTRLRERHARLFPALARSRFTAISIEGCHPDAPIELLGLLRGKTVMCGVVGARSRRVDAPDRVAHAIGQVLRHVPAADLVATTDWGLAALGRDVVVAKLRALAAGAALARQSLASPHPEPA